MNDDGTQRLMRAAVLNEYVGTAGLVVQDVPRPVPGAGEVLIEVAPPINPSDLAFLEGNYSPRPPLPTRAGLEGSGTVVAAGPGAMGRYLSGKRVAFVAGGRGGEAWAEYVVVPNRLALPLSDEVSFGSGAMSVVNPLTALAFLEIPNRAGTEEWSTRYDPEATDDAATLETLRTLGTHQCESSSRSDRGLEVLNGLSDKHSAGAVLTETDHVMMPRLLERFETGLA